MMNHPHPSCILLLNGAPAVNESLAAEAVQNRWPMVRITTAGDALRHLRRHTPRCAILPVGREQVSELSSLIGELRRHRPDVPLIAVATDDDPSVERAMRGAGVACYLTLARNAGALLGAMASLNRADPERNNLDATTHSGLAPPGGPSPPADPSVPRQRARGEPRAPASRLMN